LSIKITQNLIGEFVDGHFEETNYRKSAFFIILIRRGSGASLTGTAGT